MKKAKKPVKIAKMALCLSSLLVANGVAQAVEIGNSEWSGYLRQHSAWNLQDAPETEQDDKHDLNMLRTTLLIQGQGYFGDVNWTIIGRSTWEKQTDYLERLEDKSAMNAMFVGGEAVDLKDEYEDTAELREAYIDFDTGNLHWRLGKQQVVWGETDVFHPNDVIHGYDHTWHSLFAVENEEMRKPLLLANLTWDLSEQLGGSLQFIYRPGWDSSSDLGNRYDFNGGRWAQNGTRGFNLNSALIPIDYHYEDGDTDDANYGFRWEGNAGEDEDVTYGFSYYKGLALEPRVVSAFDPVYGGDKISNPGPFEGGGLAFIYQEIDTFGASISGYTEMIDTVYRVEYSFTPDRFYNDQAAFGGISENDTHTLTVGLDTNLRLQNKIATSSPSLLSVQVFDTFISDYDEGTQMFDNGFGGAYKEHNVFAVSKFNMPFMNDTLIVDLSAVFDLTEGGLVFWPSIEKHFGPHWRLRLEANMFYGGDKNSRAADPSGNDPMSAWGSFENADTLIARITYQF